MLESDDIALLKEYAESGSEAAFTALVGRHVNLVYSAALRSVGNAHAAQEIAQAVFIILARKAGQLSRRTVLSGWLYQTARLTAANYLRGEIRRQHREQEAYMQSILNQPDAEAWRQIAPLLDDAMGRLGEKDRNAIVLRFFENKNLAEVGAALGASEDAAKMRVNRALEKLRKFFTKRGVTHSVAIIAGAVSANSVQAAPVALAKVVSAVAIAKGAAASASTLTLVKGALKIMAWLKMQTAVVIVAASILTVGGTAAIVEQTHSPANAAQNISGDDARGTMAAYRKAVGATTSGWSKFDYLSGTNSAFQNRLATLVTNAAGAESLTGGQKAGLTNELLVFFRAYNTGTYDAYKAFRMPSEVPFELQTNKLGSLVSALQNGRTIALPMALNRWAAEIKGKSIDWTSRPIDEQFLAYVKLYSGDALYSNYLAGISFDQSRIVVTQFKASPIPGAWETKFLPKNAAETMVTAPTSFPNMGYGSQSAYTFIKFKDTVEDTRLNNGMVTVADCVLFCHRNKPDSPLPLIVRLFWETKTARWLPADVVVCNMEDKGNIWPIF